MGHRFDKKQPLFHGFDKIDHFLQKSHSLSEKSRFLQQLVYLVKTVKKWLFLIKSVPKWSISLSLSVSKLAFLPHKAETHTATFCKNRILSVRKVIFCNKWCILSKLSKSG